MGAHHITYAFKLQTRAFDPDVVRGAIAQALEGIKAHRAGRLDMSDWAINVVPPWYRHSALRVMDRCTELMHGIWLDRSKLDYAHEHFCTVISDEFHSGALEKYRITTVS